MKRKKVAYVYFAQKLCVEMFTKGKMRIVATFKELLKNSEFSNTDNFKQLSALAQILCSSYKICVFFIYRVSQEKVPTFENS